MNAIRMAAAIWISGTVLLAAQSGAVTARTSDAVLIETGGAGVSFALTEVEYQAQAAQLSKLPSFVTMAVKPAGVSASARFGFNFVLDGKNRSWALDGDDTNGYVWYPDLNANGDLSDDTPIRFERIDGKYSLRFHADVKADATSGPATYPTDMKLVVDRVPPPGKTEGQLGLLRYDAMMRVGTIQIAGRPIDFSIVGNSGIYNEDYNRVTFDLNGDGTLDPKDERYQICEQFVNIGDVTYAFAVDRYGRSLTLTPQAEKRAPRGPGRLALSCGGVSDLFPHRARLIK